MKVTMIMSIISKALTLAALGQSAHDSKVAVERFFTNLSTALVFALLSSMMLGAVIVGAHFLVYQILLETTTLSPLASLAITFGSGLVLTGILAGIAVWRLKTMFSKPSSSAPESGGKMSAFDMGEKIGHKIGGIAEAFIDGLKAPPHRAPPARDNVTSFSERHYR